MSYEWLIGTRYLRSAHRRGFVSFVAIMSVCGLVLGVATLIDVPFGGPGGRNLLRAVQGKPIPNWARDFEAASWSQLLLKYVLANPAVTCVIPGTRNPEHMADNLAAGRGRLPDAAQRQQIARLIEELG